ncbi:hypothetical protein F5B19DRAFT_479647 [Rostrohypoxylon terebratum]|nr:hypothetical protein F5B19DRAFT_479647 [Rostrohypoxylon terebratum]
MFLEGLPVEIQNNIFSRLDNQNERQYADNGHPNLCALALTCRRLSEIANGRLYSHVKLEINGDSAKDAERMAILNNCCREFPHLVNRIHSAELRWFYKKDVETYNELLGHLAKSSSLTKLGCELTGFNCASLPALFDYVDGSFAHLTELEIELNRIERTENYVPAEYFVKLCELPKLDVFVVSAPIAGFGTDAVSESEKSLDQLKHFHFWRTHPISIAALESLLPRVPNLICLQTSAPGEGIEVDRKLANDTSLGGFDLIVPLRPSMYGDLLAPVATSLKHLVLDIDNVHIHSHDGSRIDLSRFTSMFRLEISSSFLFASNKVAASCAWAYDIGQILPPRLEDLEFLFDNHQGLFWSVQEMRQHAPLQTFKQLWARTSNKGYIDWLLQLMARNHDNTSCIKAIKISEQIIVDRDPNWKIVTWRMTDDLIAAAASAGVKLQIRLRVPRIFRSSRFVHFEDSWTYGAEGTVKYENDVEETADDDD